MFSSVIGQELIKNRLRNMIKENRIPHALLFVEHEGNGALPMALAFSQYIMCPHRSIDESCGNCNTCRKIEKLIHPDLHLVFPVVNTTDVKNATSDDFINDFREAVIKNPYLNLNQWIEIIASENKQGNIFEAESTRIIEKLSYKPYESDYKIMIIWMAEKMNIHCANKLLKIIEEPPENTIFILISETQENILPTILSRCQIISFPPIAIEEMIEALKAKIRDSVKLNTIVRNARGNYLKAIQLIENQEEDNQWLEYFIKLMRLAFKRDFIGLIDWSNEMSTLGREKQKRFLLYALKLIRENFALTIVGKEISYFNEEEENFSKNFHPYVNELNVEKIIEEFELAIKHIERNGNSKIIFLDVALQLSRVIRIKK